MVSILLFSILTINGAEAKEKGDQGLEKLYHVYTGDQYLGAVPEKEPVLDWMNSKKEELKKEHDLSAEVYLEDKLAIIPERVFQAPEKNGKVLDQIEETAIFKTDAKALKVDGETIAYVESEKEVEKALELVKKTTVSDKELSSFQDQSEAAEELEAGESTVTNIQLQRFDQAVKAEVSPENILSAEKAAEKLKKGTKKESSYKTVKGDTPEKIGEKFNMKEEKLLELNPNLEQLTPLKPGTNLNVIKPIQGVTVRITSAERVTERIPHEKKVVKDKDLLVGETRVKQEGRDGEKEFTIVTTEEDGKEKSQTVKDEKVTDKPVTEIVAEGTKEIPSKGTGSFIWPTNGGYISSHQGPRWGKHHKGIDIAQPDDYTIKTVDNGTVISAGNEGDYGNKVVVDHNNGLRTIYAHLDKIHVKKGQIVKQGESLGIMGDTGFSTGIHLHFEVYSNGKLQNPMDYLE
ncbi:peptidoglycan DD-metalloendopeptidase family protein [Jeotgalibacillus sp. ET6]|uniref:LysM peptidoglycan-binding domain-containing M23 family metallopeptidase n=1 Tax=Jeotgalibacillus sp. ET6 TaxID=3037260 RepID=UPI00241831B2|nr:M23 family metallopeptidase [Jeotgalibacillus sp. ET6]MDG5472370.1 peptidoglycan DD-metalloendopeptidase family protein [Jeotgalibacillus sp. ET6]